MHVLVQRRKFIVGASLYTPHNHTMPQKKKIIIITTCGRHVLVVLPYNIHKYKWVPK